MVIVYKSPVSLISKFKHYYSPDLEKADFDRQSFQYTQLNSDSVSSFRELRPNIFGYQALLGNCDMRITFYKNFVQASDTLLYYIFCFCISYISLSNQFPQSPPEVVTLKTYISARNLVLVQLDKQPSGCNDNFCSLPGLWQRAPCAVLTKAPH